MRAPALLLCALLTPAAIGFGPLLQTFRFPTTPFASGVHYINSPEHFLRTHGLCGYGFTLDSTLPPSIVGGYACVTLQYHTALERGMNARVFASGRNYSHFMLSNSEGVPCVVGHLRVFRLHQTGGCVLRCYACRIRPAETWHARLGVPQPTPEEVGAAMRDACSATVEDTNLRAYRRMVLALGQR